MILVELSKNDGLANDNRLKLLGRAFNNALKINNDSLKSKYYSQISLGSMNLGDSLFFRKTNGLALQSSIRAGDSVTLAESHWDLGTFFRDNTVEDSAYFHFASAQKIYSSIGNEFLSGRMLYNMAAVQGDVRDYTGSEINTFKAIELLKPLDKFEQLYQCYNNLGAVYSSLGEHTKALEYFKLALNYLSKFKDGNAEFIALNNIGDTYLNQKDYVSAIVYFQRVISAENLKELDPNTYSKALSNYARTRLHLKDTVGIKNAFSESLELQDSINDIVGLSLTNYYLAEYALSKKDTSGAIAYAKKSKALAKRSSNNKRLLESLELISKLDTKNAPQYVQQYISLNDSLQKEERQIRNKFARIEFETDQFIEQNQLLARQKQLWLGVAIGLFFLAIAIVSIISLRIKNQKLKFDQQQQKSNLEIFNLMLSQKEKFLEGKHEEQKRVSEELHDGILGQMLGIRLVLSGLNNKNGETSAKQRAEYLKKLQDVEEEVRTISHELNHAAYQKIHNFIYSVQDLLKSIESSSKVHCNFEFTTHLEWDRLDSEVKINIYRILQEALQNCTKHAFATNINIILGCNEKDILVRVEDDGVGYQAKNEKKGIGLKNITSRVKKMNGTVAIKSKIGKGTSLLVKIPFADKILPNDPIHKSINNEL
ncbi:tetratricopeptide repeat-containing sensor histidine kinase [Sediminicola sp. YIK13]|uniref:tetratricopeptide repeat-containing sensor histidine kinase n=1 Tax=Sediminicola sp. YIK13 TaxID=1453352 RepID=UPI000A4207EB|nr:tetratricopeptide repeat protein [Sediminicola sp. YIK13]